MRCDEIKERFVDLLYDERGTPPASPELKAHIDSCPNCRRELDELRELRGVLRGWEDEKPLRPVWIPEAQRAPARPRFSFLRVVRYAGIAALVVLALLAVSNAEFTRTRDGFSFKTHAFSRDFHSSDYYTKAEVKKIVKEAIRDSEAYQMESNNQQLNAALDLIDKQMGQELRYVRSRYTQSKSKN